MPSSNVRRTLTLAAATLATAAGLAATAQPAIGDPYDGPGCAEVEVIGARGTSEAPGFGNLLAPQVTEIQNRLSQTVSAYALPYPASLNYPSSVAEGEQALRDRLVAESGRCPSKTFVLLGYSQGANVVGDTLDSGGTQLDPAVRDRVSALVLFGDPRFRGGEPFNRGTHDPARGGIFARGAGELAAVADRTVSYCDTGDGICQDTFPIPGDAHGQYAKYRADATTFVASRYGQ